MKTFEIKTLKDSDGLYISDYPISYVYDLNSSFDFKYKLLASSLVYATYHYNLENTLRYTLHDITNITVGICKDTIVIFYNHLDTSNNINLLFCNDCFYLDEKNNILYACDDKIDQYRLIRKLKMKEIFV